jgi:hypothetical protein
VNNLFKGVGLLLALANGLSILSYPHRFDYTVFLMESPSHSSGYLMVEAIRFEGCERAPNRRPAYIQQCASRPGLKPVIEAVVRGPRESAIEEGS